MHLPHIFHLPPLPPGLDWLPPLLGIAVLLLLLRTVVRGACRLCLLVVIYISQKMLTTGPVSKTAE